MKFLFALIVLLAGISTVSAATDTVACTMEYAPVCGMVQVQCITAPCNPVRTDFSNLCTANAAGATEITGGTCIMSESTPPVVGGDIDSHGCKASAGYSWDPMMSQCMRPWEKSDTLVKWAYGSGLTRYTTVDTFGYDRSLSRQEAAAFFARAGEKTLGLRYASYPDVCNIPYTDDSTFD
jgi:hypothetical protein